MFFSSSEDLPLTKSITPKLNDICLDLAAQIDETLTSHDAIFCAAPLVYLHKSLWFACLALLQSDLSIAIIVPTPNDGIALKQALDLFMHSDEIDGDIHADFDALLSILPLHDVVQEPQIDDRHPRKNTFCFAWLTPQMAEDGSLCCLAKSILIHPFYKMVYLWGYQNSEAYFTVHSILQILHHGDLHNLEFPHEAHIQTYITTQFFQNPHATLSAPASPLDEDYWSTLDRSSLVARTFDTETLRQLAQFSHMHHENVFLAEPLGNTKHKKNKHTHIHTLISTSAPSNYIWHEYAPKTLLYFDTWDDENLQITAKSPKTPAFLARHFIAQSEFSLLSLLSQMGLAINARANAETQSTPPSLSSWKYIATPFAIWQLYLFLYRESVFSDDNRDHAFQIFHSLSTIYADLSTNTHTLSTDASRFSTIVNDLSTNSDNLSTNTHTLSTICGKLSTPVHNLSTTPLSVSHVNTEKTNDDANDAKALQSSYAQFTEILRHWRNIGLIEIHPAPNSTGNQEISMTPKGRRCFLCATPIDALNALWTFKQKTRLESLHHEHLADIDTDFFTLPASQFFPLHGIYYKRHFHDILEHKVALSVANALQMPFWLDALPILLSPETCLTAQSILANDENPETWLSSSLVSLSPEALKTLRAMQTRFRPHDDTPKADTLRLEIAANDALLWTFAGGKLNAILALCMQHIAPKLDFSYGNFCLYMKWSKSTNCPKNHIAARIEEILQTLNTWQRDDTAHPMETIVQKCHSLHWLWPLLPPSWKKHQVQHTLDALQRYVLRRKIVVTPISDDASMHFFDASMRPSVNDASPATTESSASTKSPISHSSLAENAEKTHAVHTKFARDPFPNHLPIQSATRPTPILPNVLHTELPWFFIDDQVEFQKALNVILKQRYIGLDVETTLFGQNLRLIQIGCQDRTYIIDPLSIDFSDIAQVMTHPHIAKLIHNATFEKSVLGKCGIQIFPIIDTMKISRAIFGFKAPNGHSLKALCKRIFDTEMNKENQTSDWSIRPLSNLQLEYAALDAEILVRLFPKLAVLAPQLQEYL